VEILSAVHDAETPDGPMAVLHYTLDGGDWPVVAMFHDGPGIRTATHEFAKLLAGAGYQVVIPDLFHRHGRMIGIEPADRAADPEGAGERMMRMVRSLEDESIQTDMDAGLGAAGIDPDRPVATIGFCLGARAVAHALLSRPDRYIAGAMWHPSFLANDSSTSPHLRSGQLSRPLYIGIGGADTAQPQSLQQPFLDAAAPTGFLELEVFPGAEHGFTWPDHPSYHEIAATSSFEHTTMLFGKAFA
jgi:carboxymethylenebutenolidase